MCRSLSTDELLEQAQSCQNAGDEIRARRICVMLLHQEWMGERKLSRLQRGMAYAIPSDLERLFDQFHEEIDDVRTF